MKHRLEGFARLMGAVARLALWISGGCLVLMTALVFWQVVARYILNAPSTITEPLSILLMGWFIFLGAAVGTREGYHLSFDVLLHALPDRLAWVLHAASDVAVAAFGVGMFWYGGLLMRGTWGTALPSTGLPSGVALLPVVLGGAMIVVFSLERLARRAAGLPTARFGEAGDPQEGV